MADTQSWELPARVVSAHDSLCVPPESALREPARATFNTASGSEPQFTPCALVNSVKARSEWPPPDPTSACKKPIQKVNPYPWRLATRHLLSRLRWKEKFRYFAVTGRKIWRLNYNTLTAVSYNIQSLRSLSAFSPRILPFSSSPTFMARTRLTARSRSLIWCGKSVPSMTLFSPEKA